MSYEVVVVGAGLGGLTAAALLAARGVSVCVVERESYAGGCVAAVEKFGYTFEPTAGLYRGFGAGGIIERVFAELPVEPPEARKVFPAYTVRTADGAQVRVGSEDEGEADADLCLAFPECAGLAVGFFRELSRVAEARRGRERTPISSRHEPPRRRFSLFGKRRDAREEEEGDALLAAARGQTVAGRLEGAPARFRRFVDAQLQLFALCAGEECSVATAAEVFAHARRAHYAIEGGAAALADALVESVRRSGGTVRFDTTALRLAEPAHLSATGVVLLSGETVRATRAVVSNLTAWDTYGKLARAAPSGSDERARLKALRGWGAYLVLFGVDEEAASRLPSTRVVALADAGDDAEAGESATFDPTRDLFALNVAPAWDARAPAGKRAATLAAFADSAEWFAYHEDEEEHEAQDSRALEFWWGRLHAALPELGAGAEVIETLTPRGYYERTRRRLGAVWGVARTREVVYGDVFDHLPRPPNLHLVGDTAAGANGVASVAEHALEVADEIAPPRKKTMKEERGTMK
ncbi:MAG: FAD-dependent oxidoreductase [Acidobacteria bacterium]|nr:FAD-dependent oxidoreductase [Acidobacteriota bacterium]